jgi:hypothetical protein
LLEDSHAPVQKRIFQRPIDPQNISETDLREFGAVILDVHKQIPLRKKLTRAIRLLNAPIVVDSIRDLVDVDASTMTA